MSFTLRQTKKNSTINSSVNLQSDSISDKSESITDSEHLKAEDFLK